MHDNPLLASLSRGLLTFTAAVLGTGDDLLSLAGAHFISLTELERLCQEQPANYIVEGLLPADEIHVAVGDSGLGKTAWAYQLGLCVAAGKPFLGFPVRQGRVLYFDMENGREEIIEVGRSLCSHLEIDAFPPDFLVRSDEAMNTSLANAVAQYSPALVIVDTLRAFRPEAERSNDEMGRFLQDLRCISRKEHCAILLLHHVKKPGEFGVPDLAETPTMEWLLQASGARALVNQTNTRIAFDRPRRNENAAFVMKSYVKMKGETESIHIERVCDDAGNPVGYRRLVGVGLLNNPDQEAAYGRLPAQEQFTFNEAKAIYGRSADPTNKWLKKCEAAGLLEKLNKRGPYRKVRPILENPERVGRADRVSN